MFVKRSLKFKLVLLGVILSVTPLGVVTISTFYQNRHMTDAAADGLSQLAHESLTHTVAGIRTMVATQNEILQEQVISNLNVARRVMRDGGGGWLSIFQKRVPGRRSTSTQRPPRLSICPT